MATVEARDWLADIEGAKRLLKPQLAPEDWTDEGSAAVAVPTTPVGEATPLPRFAAELRESAEVDTPAVLTGLLTEARGWDMVSLQPGGFGELFPAVSVDLSGSDNDGGKVSVPLGSFCTYMARQDDGRSGDDEPLCVFDRTSLYYQDHTDTVGIDDGVEGGVNDATGVAMGCGIRALFAIPDVEKLEFRRCHLEKLGPVLCPPVHYLLLGPTRSGTHMHTDPAGTATWNAATVGRKRWAMLSPGCAQSLALRQSPPEGCDWSISEWFEQEWPAVAREAAAAGHAVYDFMQEGGEIVYIPPGWWHAVLNVQSCLVVSYNYLPSRSIDAVVRIAGGLPEAASSAVGQRPISQAPPTYLARQDIHDAAGASGNAAGAMDTVAMDTAAVGISDGMVEAVLEAYQLVDSEDGRAARTWLENLRDDGYILVN